MPAAADDLKRVTFRAGATTPPIVLDDVNPDAVAEGLLGAFQNSGQVCRDQAPYVPETLHDSIVAKLVDRAKRTKVGNGMEADAELGPINNDMCVPKGPEPGRGREEVGRQDRGRRRAHGVEGPRRRRSSPVSRGRGSWSTRSSSAPRCRSSKYKHLSDALEQANARTTASAARVVVEPDRAKRSRGVRVRHRVGEPAHRPLSPLQPSGGHKWSGIGVENGKWGYNEFTQVQVVDTMAGLGRSPHRQTAKAGEQSFPGPSRFRARVPARRSSGVYSASRSAD